jgi:hypothetical protein
MSQKFDRGIFTKQEERWIILGCVSERGIQYRGKIMKFHIFSLWLYSPLEFAAFSVS